MPPILGIKFVVICLVSGAYIASVIWFLFEVINPWIELHGGWFLLNRNQKLMVIFAYAFEYIPVIFLYSLIQLILRF